MSPEKPKYKLVDAFFARIRPVAPDAPPRERAGGGSPAAGGRPGFSFLGNRAKQIGFAYERGSVAVLGETPVLPESALRIPLTVSGTPVGSIQAARRNGEWSAQEIEILTEVAALLGRQIETLLRKKKPD